MAQEPNGQVAITNVYAIMAHDKYIRIGVSGEEHRKMDVKASQETTTFQALGEAFFRAWLEGKVSTSATPTANSSAAYAAIEDLAAGEKELINDLLVVLRSGDNELRAAIIANLKQFRRYAELLRDRASIPIASDTDDREAAMEALRSVADQLPGAAMRIEALEREIEEYRKLSQKRRKKPAKSA